MQMFPGRCVVDLHTTVLGVGSKQQGMIVLSDMDRSCSVSQRYHPRARFRLKVVDPHVHARVLVRVLAPAMHKNVELTRALANTRVLVAPEFPLISQLVGANFLPAIAGRTQAEVQEAAQKHFFLRVALAEPATLLGFLGFVLSANPAVYGLGAVVSLAGMLDARPSTRWLDRGQLQLRESGSEISLLGVLVQGGVTR